MGGIYQRTHVARAAKWRSGGAEGGLRERSTWRSAAQTCSPASRPGRAALALRGAAPLLLVEPALPRRPRRLRRAARRGRAPGARDQLAQALERVAPVALLRAVALRLDHEDPLGGQPAARQDGEAALHALGQHARAAQVEAQPHGRRDLVDVLARRGRRSGKSRRRVLPPAAGRRGRGCSSASCGRRLSVAVSLPPRPSRVPAISRAASTARARSRPSARTPRRSGAGRLS